MRSQQQRQRGWKLYSLHAPVVESIAKGKAHKPYEFGCIVSITTTNAHFLGGTVIAETQALTGVEIKRVYVDKGYIGHNAPKPLRVYRSGQKRGVHGQIKKELRRRAAIEPVIGHLKSEGHLERNYLKGRHGDHANAVLTAAGHNLRLVLRWLRMILCKFIAALITDIAPVNRFLTVDDVVTEKFNRSKIRIERLCTNWMCVPVFF